LKINIKTIFILFLCIFFANCKSNKTISKTGTKQVNTEFISGIVTEMQQGKDGYTAKITTANNQVYFVTISHSNLKDPAQYRSAKVGTILTVKGDIWKVENETHITVKEFQ
jgi:hypothetical protein